MPQQTPPKVLMKLMSDGRGYILALSSIKGPSYPFKTVIDDTYNALISEGKIAADSIVDGEAVSDDSQAAIILDSVKQQIVELCS